jgi:antirestriction protein ArdC
MPTELKRDHRREVTDAIIALLEKGTAPWQKPWTATAPFEMPQNLTTAKPYRGGNAVYLMGMAAAKGYDDPRWMTYKQAQERGWQVRRGEPGTHIEFWQFADRSQQGTSPEPTAPEGDDQPKADLQGRRPLHRVYTVFNASQIDGVPPHTPRQRPEFQAVEAGERILANSGATIRHDQADRAFYNRASDSIHLPPKEAFKNASGYYGTALHELAHWSGHPSRLNRQTLNESYRFGDSNYAKEELRAELASVFLAAERGIPHDPERHAAYVGSWITALKDDKNEFFRAASDANKAADLLLALERERSVDRILDQTSTVAQAPTAPGSYGTRAGNLAEVLTRDPDGNWHGRILGRLDSTWWNPDGTHALYRGEDLIEARERFSPERETSEYVARYEPGLGTVEIEDKATATEHRSVASDDSHNGRDGNLETAKMIEAEILDDRPLRFSPEEPSGHHRAGETSRPSNDSMSTPSDTEAAQAFTGTICGPAAKTYFADTISGIYRGDIVGETGGLVIQRLNGQATVAHRKELLPRDLDIGENLSIAYSQGQVTLSALVSLPRERVLSR